MFSIIYLIIAENKTGENLLDSHFKSCNFSTKEYLYNIYIFEEATEFLHMRIFCQEYVFPEAVKNSLYTWSTKLVRL